MGAAEAQPPNTVVSGPGQSRGWANTAAADGSILLSAAAADLDAAADAAFREAVADLELVAAVQASAEGGAPLFVCTSGIYRGMAR
jgi:hypothetical protein